MSYREQQSYDGSFNTPRHIFRYLDRFFNFELDPCDSGNDWLGLPHSFNLGDNGLLKDWKYNTFVNPPYGKENENKWIIKCREELAKHNENHYFILLPAKTESDWFSRLFLFSDVRIFLRPRVSFIKNGKAKHGNNIGSVIFGMRARTEKGLKELRDFVNFSATQLGFKTDNDGYDSYTVFADHRVLKKNFPDNESLLSQKCVI